MSRPIAPKKVYFEIDTPVEIVLPRSMQQNNVGIDPNTIGASQQQPMILNQELYNGTVEPKPVDPIEIKHEPLPHITGFEQTYYQPESANTVLPDAPASLQEQVDELISRYNIPASDRDRILYNMYTAWRVSHEQQEEQEQQEQGRGRTN